MIRARIAPYRFVVAPGLVGLAVALLMPSEAHAWKHLNQVWMAQDLPFEWYLGADDEETMPAGETLNAITAGYDAWKDAECAELPTQYMGRVSDNPGYDFDGFNTHTFNDPFDSLAAPTLAATVLLPPAGIGTVAFVFDGAAYYRVTDTDIVYQEDLTWTTDAAINSGDCGASYSLQTVATHEIGHSFGLGHSCESNEPCDNAEYRDATMFWSIGACQTSSASIEADDIESLSLLYGPSATFVCSNELEPGNPDTIAVGNTPLTLRCVLRTEYDEEITNIRWYWGDGESTEVGTSEQEHVYDEAGNYTVRACIEGTNDTCGEWDFCFRREGYVRACSQPIPKFEVEHSDGLTYQFLNQTDLSVYGCIYDVQWDIFRGSTLLDSIPAWEPEYTFEEEGEYRVVLNIGGPAGTGAADVTFDAKKRRGEGYGGCNTGAVPMAGFGGLVALLGLLSLRRRRSA